MDIMQKAINGKRHISKNEKWNGQTWKHFFEAGAGRKVFLFGLGYSCGFFLARYGSRTKVEGIIDNSLKKQGFCAGDFIPEAVDTEYENMKISGMEGLMKYPPDETVILITSTKYYEPIAVQLKACGYENYFVMLIMENNRRIEEGFGPETVDGEREKEKYANQCCRLPVERKKLVFYSFGTYSDHGKYIAEALTGTRKDLDLVWILNDLSFDVPGKARKVFSGNWKRVIRELETAGIWIYNMPVPAYLIKRPEQIYIQTKHWASVTLKKFYLDAVTIQDEKKNVEKWKYNGRIMDYILTGSRFDTEACRRGFGFDGKVIQCGSPRSDAMFRGCECRGKVCGYFHIAPDTKILLYAPTYRFNRTGLRHGHESREVNLDFPLLRETLEKKFGGVWRILLRLHPSVAKKGAEMADGKFVLNACDYPDSQELASACDILISDYSSIMFEPAFVKKMVFLYAADKKDYIDKEYDLLIDYDTLPFPTAESNEELVKKLETFVYEEYKKELEQFLLRYEIREDGHASERAAVFLSGLIDGGKEECQG